MTDQAESVDQLYFNAEQLSQDFSLFPRKEPAAVLNEVQSPILIDMEEEKVGKVVM